MSESVIKIIESFFVGPVWPASMLLVLMMMYAVVAMIGLADLDMDVDVDIDLDADMDIPDLETGGFDGSPNVSGAGLLGGLGAMTLRWSNFGRVPIAIWGGIFTLAFWVLSYGLWHNFDSSRYSPTWIPSILLAIRNTVIAVAITKLVTQPMVGKFKPEPGYDTERIVGSTCEISSIEATPSHGQAKFRTNAAPLLLNVRTDGSTIPRGSEVRIVDFNATKRIYTVTEILEKTS